MDITLGPFHFSSSFECGNLAKVLPIHLTGSVGGSSLAQKSSKTSSAIRSNESKVDYEFNLWTKPDCGGTEFENNNRTWFCFCIKGGVAGDKVQLSVMNLNKQSKLYSQGMQPVVKCVGESVQSPNWERIKEKCSYRSEDNSTVITWIHTVPPESRATYYAFTYPYSYSQLQSFLRTLDQRFNSNSSGLYYYHELLTKSLDGSNVDLLTITSNAGKLEEKEHRLPGLFPDWECPRPHRFEGKKVVFVSARVHPGETPSSFVLNGFITFILSSDARAKRLRDLFVFKIIPMLNPDGVIRGHYRTDQRGVNLNRVYSSPSPDLHPTIYAAKKLILYYHHKMSLETILNVKDEGSVTNAKDFTSDALPPKSTPSLMDEDTCHSFSDAVINKSKILSGTSGKTAPLLDVEEPSVSGWDCSSNISIESSCRSGFLQNQWEEIQDDCSNKFCTSGETGVTSMFGSMSPLKDFKIITKSEFKTPSQNTENVENLDSSLPLSASELSEREPESEVNKDIDPKHCLYLFHADQRKENSPKLQMSSVVSLDKLGSIHSPAFTIEPSSVLNDSKSNLFMYMDFHGHASKRGIFMYGNWFENPVLMVENMLYPKLLSLNCSNFDFGACNFSERNMYHRDRRDGMSKEGSGRVSVMRSTGLIRSYTLECNYNTGRVLSSISSYGSQARPTTFHGVPPKYTPSTFEDCGQKLGVCLHDLVENSDSSKASMTNSTSSSSTSSSAVNLNTLRTELYNSLSSQQQSASPRASNLSSCSVHGSTPSPKMGSGKNVGKDLKSGVAEESSPTQNRASTSKAKSWTLSKVSNLSLGSNYPQKASKLHAYSGGRRQSLSAVDAENQEPQQQRGRIAKTKGCKGKKDTGERDTSQVKTKKLRYKSGSTKKLNIAEESHFPSKDKLGSPKHNLSASVCLPGDLNYKVTVTEKSDSSKLMKKIEKGRKPRAKSIKFSSKKLKNISSCDASSKGDQFANVAIKESEDNLGTLAIDPCCVSPPNPLSPRSPLASVFEAQTSQSTTSPNINLKQKTSSFVVSGSTKSGFHPCPKRAPKSLKSIPSSSDRFPVVPPTTGQRLKLFPKKVKKKVPNTGEVSGKLLSKPTTSQAPLQWVIRKPLKIGSDMDASSSSLNPRVKKRKKSTRKSL